MKKADKILVTSSEGAEISCETPNFKNVTEDIYAEFLDRLQVLLIEYFDLPPGTYQLEFEVNGHKPKNETP